MSAWGRDNTAAATYHHVVHKSVDSVRFDCGLGEENLRVYLDVLLRLKTLAGVCWQKDRRCTSRAGGMGNPYSSGLASVLTIDRIS